MKYLLLLPGAVFPYMVLLSLYGLFSGFFVNTIYQNPLLLIPTLFLFFILALACSIVFLAMGLAKKWDAKKVALANMIVKLIQIPAYVITFLLGVIFILTIFTYALSFLLVLFDCLTIILTGLTGACAAIRGYKEQKTTVAFSVANGILQFIFCADVVCAILLFIKCRAREKASNLSPTEISAISN